MGAKPGDNLPADDGAMLSPEEYTVPGIEIPQIPTEQESVAETVKRAREGNIEASKEVFTEFVSAVERHNEKTWLGTVPWPYVRFVADRLKAVLKGDPTVTAVNLGIKSGRPARPPGSEKYSHLAVAAFYFLLVRAAVAPKAAKSLMTEGIGASDDVIEEAAKAYPGFQYRDRFTVEILVELAAVYRGKIAEIIAAQKLRLS